MMDGVQTLWVYLAATPLLWLMATLATYAIADRISKATDRHPLTNPVLLSVIPLALILWWSKTPYTTYFTGASFVHFMLGPATVALAIPLVAEFKRVRRLIVPIALALAAGSLTAIVSAVGIAWALGAPHAVMASLAPKSATTPIAMGIAALVGGIPSLTAVIVVSTGILTAIVAAPLARLLRIKDHAAHGFAAGLAGHGIATARAFHDGPLAGTFAGLALALNGILTAVLVPLVMRFW
jgi:predicted murein hydrolase (TIGR00659 family)